MSGTVSLKCIKIHSTLSEVKIKKFGKILHLRWDLNDDTFVSTVTRSKLERRCQTEIRRMWSHIRIIDNMINVFQLTNVVAPNLLTRYRFEIKPVFLSYTKISRSHSVPINVYESRPFRRGAQLQIRFSDTGSKSLPYEGVVSNKDSTT